MQLRRPRAKPDILVTGANGALGQKLITLLGPERAVAGTRHENWDAGPFEHVSLVNDSALNEIDWQRFRVVINTAVKVRGSLQELTDANVFFPTRLARAARTGNVTKFVQLSSFAVYGVAEFVDDHTPELPASDYGHTKAEGDRQLTALATKSFQVALVRFPFLFDAQHPAFFNHLFRLIKILPVLPVSPIPTRRSMITYTDAARTLISVSESPCSGILHSAAPRLFDFELLTNMLRDEAKLRLRTVSLPNVVVDMVRLTAPAIHRRIFQSSALCPDLNIATGITDIEGIEKSLRELVCNYFR